LVQAKPNFFWNNVQMRRAGGQLADSGAERIVYAFLRFIIGLALVLMAFG
jgi:hypothetical protein